ncbi:tRNA pseudouridine(38-40) synthase TruA [Gorillibacterium timonense]|uniref:tRNA pseudouridine(38-40) synthase TruA n=1 Tax=Gorillibacterium timonense TaxID=1689269 RepID=UPI00071C84FA|nr:tRNA pseudouridine(38-40) synthase TruA [Gorillibacterium timonense]
MRNIAMVVSYDGTGYSGFQTQPDGNTIQDKLEAAIRHLTGEQLKIIGSGRTDAGVHARGQVFNFTTGSQIPVERWCLALNSRLPHDIVVRAAQEVPADFHARRSAKRKTYRYSIQRSKFPDVFHRNTRFHHPMPLAVRPMREALAAFTGEHNFTSFCSTRTPAESHVRTIFSTRLIDEPYADPEDGDAGVIHLEVTGSGFLYNMVRIIAGTVIEVGEGKRSPSEIPLILAGENRGLAGPTAVPHGLTLWNVEYNSFQTRLD